MSAIACLSTLPIPAPAPERSRNIPATTAPREPARAEHRAGSATIGITPAWSAFFAIAIGQPIAVSWRDVLQLGVIHLP
jgi:hypothetical protein